MTKTCSRSFFHWLFRVFLLVFSIDSYCEASTSITYHIDGSIAIELSENSAIENERNLELSIDLYSQLSIHGDRPELTYTLVDSNNNRTTHPLPYPEGKEKELHERWVNQRAYSSKPMTEQEMSIVQQHTDYTADDLTSMNAFITGTNKQKMDALRNINHPALLAPLINKLTQTGVPISELVEIILEKPNSLQDGRLDWSGFQLDELNENQRRSLINALTMDTQSFNGIKNTLCLAIRNATSRLFHLRQIRGNDEVFNSLKKTLALFNFASELALDPNSNCNSGLPMGVELTVLMEKINSTTHLSDKQKRKLNKLYDNKPLKTQIAHHPEISAFNNKKCDSIASFLGKFKLCDLSDVLLYLHQQSSKDSKPNAPSVQKNRFHSAKSKHCSITSIYQVNAQVLENVEVIISDSPTGKKVEKFNLDRIPLDEYQKQVWSAYLESQNK